MRKLITCIFICLTFPLLIIGQDTLKNVSFKSPLDIPLILAGNFGELRSNHFHTGIDLKTQGVQGKRIYAIEDGFISRINISTGGYGNALYIDHPNGYTSVYAHMKSFNSAITQVLVKEQKRKEKVYDNFYPQGQILKVKKGDIIGYSGNSGSSSAPHLHFEIRETITEHPVNPLLFSFPIKDAIKPTVFALKFYPLSDSSFINKSSKNTIIKATGSSGQYNLENNQIIKVQNEFGIAVHTIDRLNGANNKCGIYNLTLQVDGKPYFKQQMKKLDFSTNRYINTHKDYYEYCNYKRSYHKSFLSKNNVLEIYPLATNNGRISFNDNKIHQLKYIIEDVHGNISEVNFKVQADNNSWFNKNESDKKSQIDCLNSFYYRSDNFKINIPEKALYDDLEFKYSERPKFQNSFSHLHSLIHKDIPVQIPFEINIKCDSIKKEQQEKACIAIYEGNNIFTPVGGVYKNGWIKGETRTFGTYTVLIDSIPPAIQAINVYNGKNVKQQKRLSFRFEDNLSGVTQYNAYVDGEWIPLYYNKYYNYHYFPIKDAQWSSGKHDLMVYAIDERGNKTQLNYHFYF